VDLSIIFFRKINDTILSEFAILSTENILKQLPPKILDEKKIPSYSLPKDILHLQQHFRIKIKTTHYGFYGWWVMFQLVEDGKGIFNEGKSMNNRLIIEFFF